jgi:hypothetical protein
MPRLKVDLQFTTGVELFHAWKDDAEIAKRWIIDPAFNAFPTQSFVWQRFTNIHAKHLIEWRWWRRHIRMTGDNKTLCHMYCGDERPIWHEWKNEPDENGIADECPECRIMAEYYHRKSVEQLFREG